MTHDKVYEKFLEETGLSVSRSTFYQMRKEVRTGNNSRLTRILENDLKPVIPKELRKSFNKHANIDEVPFIAFDGEGVTVEGKHNYVLMAASDGSNLYRPNGISTTDALTYLIRTKSRRAIRIFFSFGYDVQQILKDVPDRDIIRLMKGDVIRYGNFRLHYLPGKIFAVNNIRFYDVFNYWQTSFIKAVQETLGKDAISDSLVKGKESRGDFASWNIDDILRYTNEELDLLVQLATHLREIFLRLDIHLGSAFYGPGSIANYWFRNHKISPPKIDDPQIKDVMERAYFGGRFETFTLGKIEPVYECDINSAYPAIIAELPYLDGWEWYPPHNYDRSEYSVWKVEWHLPISTRIGPFPSRDKHGLISYPANGIGWYWKPEIDAAIALFGTQSLRILGGYIPKIIEGRPFEWVEGVYNRRLELKEVNDPAQQGLKIGLNSIYGKTAQRVGSAKYFSLAWAGYITSSTRAKLLRLTKGRENSVIAYATDAVYFDRNPQIVSSNRLGEFGSKRWTRGFFIQSGVYRLEHGDLHKDAYRGFSVKNGIQDIFDQIHEHPFKHPFIYQLKFIGLLEAIRCPLTLGPYKLSFITVKKKLQPFKTTKRKVLDPDIFTVLDQQDDAEHIENLINLRGADFLDIRLGPRKRGASKVWSRDVYVWYDYRQLLTRRIQTQILENHNDHGNYFQSNDHELEDSYPFMRITDRHEDLAFSDVDEIVVERLGGSSGLIGMSHVGNRPIVDEDDVFKELRPNGN